MAGSSMSPEYDVIAMVLPDFLDDTNFDLSPDLPIKEEMIMAVMQELYNEINNNNKNSTTSLPATQPERVFTPTKGGEAVVGGEIGGAAVVKESASETAVIMEVEDQEGDVEEWVSELLEGRNGAELRDEWLRRWVPQQSLEGDHVAMYGGGVVFDDLVGPSLWFFNIPYEKKENG